MALKKERTRKRQTQNEFAFRYRSKIHHNYSSSLPMFTVRVPTSFLHFCVVTALDRLVFSKLLSNPVLPERMHFLPTALIPKQCRPRVMVGTHPAGCTHFAKRVALLLYKVLFFARSSFLQSRFAAFACVVRPFCLRPGYPLAAHCLCRNSSPSSLVQSDSSENYACITKT